MTRLPLWMLVSLPLAAIFTFVLLMLPVWYSWQEELVKGQQAALQISAQGFTAMLAEDPRYRRFLEDEAAEVTYRAVSLAGPVTLDGRLDDWPDARPVHLGLDNLLEANEPYSVDSLTASLSVGVDSANLYIHLSVTDDFVVYRALNALSVHRNDHIQVGAVDQDGIYRRYTVSVVQPGDISAAEISASGRALREVDGFDGRWLATESGYNVELSMPRSLASRRFSIVVGDVDDEQSRELRYVVGLSPTSALEALGTLVFSPTELERALQALPYPAQLSSRAGVLLTSPGFHSSAPTVTATAPIRAGEIATGELTLRQGTAPSGAMARAFGVQVLVIFSMSAFAVLLATALVFYLVRRRLQAAGREISAQLESPSQPAVPGSAHDAVDQLVLDVSQLLARVRQHNEYLERMASRLNHELRTPVSVVKSSLENLQGSDLPQDGAVYVDRAAQGVSRLTSILNKMSEARRLEEALDENEVSPFDLAEVVTGCVAGYELAFPDRRFELLVEVDEAPVTGIPELIAQMLDKLIDNAVEFSTGNVIKLRLHRENDELLLRVLNEGRELPDATVDDLFASMISVRDKAADTHLGLGLYIARMIAQFHGGELSMANREDAMGVIVTLRLPLMRLTSKLSSVHRS